MTRRSIIVPSACGCHPFRLIHLSRNAPRWKKNRDYTSDLKRLLASANICSKRWVYEQYDSMVQTNTAQGPGNEAGVMRREGNQARTLHGP